VHRNAVVERLGIGDDRPRVPGCVQELPHEATFFPMGPLPPMTTIFMAALLAARSGAESLTEQQLSYQGWRRQDVNRGKKKRSNSGKPDRELKGANGTPREWKSWRTAGPGSKEERRRT